MPSKSPLHPLLDIRDNARLAQQWTESQTLESFSDNLMIFYAVTRCLEIVSEASRRLPAALRDSYPELPWRAIMDVGMFTGINTTTYWKAPYGARCVKTFPRYWPSSRVKSPVCPIPEFRF